MSFFNHFKFFRISVRREEIINNILGIIIVLGRRIIGSIRDIEKNPEGTLLDPEALVSMNYWGFSPEIFKEAEEYLNRFLRNLSKDDLKSECLLPAFVDEQIKEGKLEVSMLSSNSKWFGMTNREDRASVAAGLKALHDSGVYPARLWDK